MVLFLRPLQAISRTTIVCIVALGSLLTAPSVQAVEPDAALLASCAEGNYDACLDAATVFFENGNLADAKRLTKLACEVNGFTLVKRCPGHWSQITKAPERPYQDILVFEK